MIELLATLVVTGSSILLFCYWFRCAYLLMRPSNRR